MTWALGLESEREDARGAVTEPAQPEGRRYTAAELMKLPRAARERILAAQVAAAAEEYRTNPALSEFEAFGEDDLYDEYPD